MLNTLRRWLACCSCIIACSAMAHSEQLAEEPEHTYVVGVENIDYYPQYAFSYRGSFAEALLSAFAADEKVRLLYNPLPVKRLYLELMSGSIDFKYPDNPDWASFLKRGKKVYYSDGVSSYIDGVYVRPENQGRSIEELATLGVVLGFTPVGYEDRIAAGKIRMISSPHLSTLLLMCMRGEIDGVYANMDLSHHWLTHTVETPNGLVFDRNLPFVKSEYRLSTTKYPEVIKRLNEFMLRETQLIDQLRATYNILDKKQPRSFR